MDDSSSDLHSTGTLVCISTLCVAFIVSYVVLQSRGRLSRRRVRGTGHRTSVLLSKSCHQHETSKELPTKDWTCSGCNGYNRSKEASSDGNGEDPCDLEIQHSLGSLAIGQISAPGARASPRSWLHLIKDLNLLPEQMSHQPRPGDGGLGGESPESVGVDTNSSTSSSSSVDCAEEQRSALADGFTRRPLIHPARLKVQKRRLSISSATAALSLAGNGWSLHGHMTEGTSGCMPNNRQPQNPFLNGGYGSNKRNSVPDLRLNNLFTSTQQEGSGERNNHFVNGRPQLVQSNRNARSTVSDIIASEHDDRNDIMLNFSGLRLPNTATSNHHVHQSPPTTVVNRQPPSVGLNHNVVKGNQSPPPGKRARCPVVTLIVFSLTTNIVLLFVLFMYVYKPSVLASSVSL